MDPFEIDMYPFEIHGPILKKVPFWLIKSKSKYETCRKLHTSVVASQKIPHLNECKTCRKMENGWCNKKWIKQSKEMPNMIQKLMN